MANLFLEAGDSFTVQDKVTVFGSTGAETLKIDGNADVTANGNVDRVELAGSAADFLFEAQGTNVLVYSGTTLVATIDAQDDADGTVVAFADGSASLVQTGLNAFTVGTAAVSTTAGGAALTSPTLDAGDPSTVAPPTDPTFSVAASAATVTEGGTATFTVSLSAAQAGATTVAYALAGTGGAVLGTDTTTVADATLTFAAGEVSKTVTVPVTFDSTVETGEGMTLTLSAPSTGTVLGTSSAAVAFADPAAPTFTLTSDAVAGAATEEGQTITYTITPSSITDKAYTFTLSTLGDTVGGVASAADATDFSPASQTVTFAAGTTTAQTVVQTIVNDGTTEGLEGYITSLLDSSFSAVATTTGLITDPTSGTGVGTVFTLTTSADNFTGTTGNDTFNGAMDDNTAANNTFTILDTVAGGTGTDTLALTVDASGAGVAFPAASVSGVEIFNIRNVSGQTVTVDTGLFSGETTLIADRATDQTDFTNIGANTTVKVVGDGATANGATNATHGATVTAGTLDIADGVTAGAIAMNGAAFTGLTINSTGAANVTGALSTTGANVTTTTINATTALTTTGLTVGTNAAAQALVVSGAAADVAATTTAAAHSAVVLGALDADFASLDASGLTAGGVSATLSATTTATFTGGAGNDTVTTSTSAQTGAVNGGTGTDTLVLAAAGHIDTTLEGALYAGFETLSSQAAAIDMDLITGSTITAITLGAAGSNVTDMTATQAANITAAGGLGASTLGIKNATQVGTSDTMTITATDGDTTGSEALVAAGDITMAGVEILNIVATDDVTFSDMSNITGLNSMVVTGGGDVSFTTLVHVLESNAAFDFSGLTGTSTFNAAGATVNAFAFTGGSGVDTVTDGVTGGNILTTGAGNDVITLTDKTGGTTVTTVNAGAGADAITSNMMGNVARDGMKFDFAAGDSVSDSTASGISATLTDSIDALDGATLAATAGASVEFDTEVQATAVTAGTTDVVLGTTTVTNAGDFFVNIDAAATTWIYQDTDGDKIIEAGEFALALTGITTNILAAGGFSVATGDLILATA